MTKNHQSFPIVIIGSGPTGLALAMGLKKIGINTTVFEQRNRVQVVNGNNERSVNITLSSRGILALKQIGCSDEVIQDSVDVVGRTYFIDGKSHFVPYTLLPNQRLHSIKRKHLEYILIQEAEKKGIKINFGYKLLEVNTSTSTCKFLHKGKEVECNYLFLFGADGINSRVRDSLCMPHSMLMLDYVYKRIEIDAKNAVDIGLNNNTVNIWPNSKGMLLSLPNKDGSHSGLFHIKGNIMDDVCVNPKLLNDYFPILVKNIVDFPTKFHGTSAGAFGTINCSRWSLRKNILLLGDAAHAMVPFYGQGTNCGFEDAKIMCDLIKKNANDIERAIFIFQDIRPKDTSAVAHLSVQNLKNLEMKQSFEDYITFKNLDLALEQKFPNYRSEYFCVAFSDLPFSKVLDISYKCHPILLEYIKRKAFKNKKSFSEEILNEVYLKLKHIYEIK